MDSPGVGKVHIAHEPKEGSEYVQDSIYNVRPWNNPLERIRSTRSTGSEADEDPGLRKPGDYKEKQVGLFIHKLGFMLMARRCSRGECFFGLPINQ